MAEKIGNNNEVVVTILGTGESSEANGKNKDFKGFSTLESKYSNIELSELEIPKPRNEIQPIKTPLSPELSTFSPSPNKPPKIPEPSLPRRRSLGTSQYSKPKSRLVEPPYPTDSKIDGEKEKLLPSNSPSSSPLKWASPAKTPVATPKDRVKTAPVTPRTPVITPPEEDDDDDDEVMKNVNTEETKKASKKRNFLYVVEFCSFVLLVGFLVASLTVKRLEDTMLWGLEIWKWFVFFIVVFCGRLVTEWFITVLVFMIEKNFLLRKKVLYFVFGLKKSVQAFLWLSLVLVTWVLLFNHGVKRSKNTTKILNYITRALVAFLVGAALWMLKTLFVKILASSFHVKRFFDRIQESIFHQYVLQALSGPPLIQFGKSKDSCSRLSFKSMKNGKTTEKEEVIDVTKLYKIKQEKVSAWTMKGLIQVVGTSRLTTLSSTLADSENEDGGEQKDSEITNEWEAKDAARRIFFNVAKLGYKYIEEEDLLRFMKKDEVVNVIPLFEGAAETGKITKKSLKKWVVNVYTERKSLSHSLNDTKTAIEELNKILSGVVLLANVIVLAVIMGLATTNILVFISSQLLLVVFVFGNTAKTVFEAIIFVFIMHPFDVGDRCVIDGVQMVVEEVNILTTVFLRYDNEKIYYPNAVLATKPISNFYRSPEMGDSVEFSVAFSTSVATVALLRERIKKYIDSKPQHWRPGHALLVKDIENMNKMNMGLYFTHTINFQNPGDKGSRRSDLVLELKNIFEDLGVSYHLPSQEIQLITSSGSASPAFPGIPR